METTEIRKTAQQTIIALEEKRIKDAFSLLGPKLKKLQDSDLIDSHYNLEMSYKSMLQFANESSSDPERQKVFNHLLQNIYQLVDTSIDKLLTKYSNEYTYETKRGIALQGSVLNSKKIADFKNIYEDIKLKSLVANEENISDDFIKNETQLFNLIWLGNESTIEIESLKSLITDDNTPWHSKSLFVSAIFLHLQQQWNLQLILILFELTQNKDHQIKMKAITSLLILLYKYDNRLHLYPEIAQRLSLLKDDKKSISLLQTIMVQFIRTRETEKISQKLQDEIIPEVVKLQPDIKQKLDLDNLTVGNPEDKNPDWQDFLSDSPELMNKLEEISKWQLEGADVFLSTFQMLKHFPFFNNLSNWFLPFYRTHPDIKNALQESGKLFVKTDLIDNISESGFLCNSDKYSLLLSIPHMPSFQRDMMGQMFQAEIEQMGDIQKDEFLIDPTKKQLMVSNQFIQDLYRFYKVNPLKNQFEDIFNWKMDFYKKWFFKQIFSDSTPIRQIGEFLFKKNYIDEALDVFNQLSAENTNEIELTQKRAYCQQSKKNYKEALDLYIKADILKPDSKWTLKKIALCYRHLNNTAKALEYYLAATKLDPENLQIQASIGGCHLELGDHEQALKHYFKVEYLDSSNTKVWRPIGWCSFVLGKFEQAEKYYQKALVSDQNINDLITLGHIKLCTNNRKEALHYYQKSLTLDNTSMSDFLRLFNQDRSQLNKHGINDNDIPVLLDQLRYSLEQ